MRAAYALAAASAALAACAPTTMQRVPSGETSIRFAANGGITDWHSNNEQSIYLRERSGRWYLARFSGQCPNLHLAQTVRFGTDAAGTFDRFSSITTEYARCQVASVVAAQRPAAKGGPIRQ